MKDHKKSVKLRKILKGLYRAEGDELESYLAMDTEVTDGCGLIERLIMKHGPRPIGGDDAEDILFECLREVSADDDTDGMVEMAVKELIEYGFVERWNGGQYW